jgi:hypothetical protein
VQAFRVPWSGASFLAYLGGFTILFAVAALLTAEADDHGSAGFALWAALVFVVVAALAFAARKTGHPITAGLLALISVVAFVVFVGSLWDWFGWLDNFELGFRGFHFAVLVLELITVVAAAVALRIFRFPLLLFVVAASAWFFTTDLISNGGNWSAIVTIAVGLVIFVAGLVADTSEPRVNGFWLHVVAGLTIGGGFLWFFHDGDLDWILVGVAGLAYIALGDRLTRSSWIVLGAWGMLQTASHFAAKWSAVSEVFFPAFYLFPFVFEFDGDYSESNRHPWLGPLVFAALGAVFLGIALFLAHRRRDTIPAAELL